MTGSSVPAVTPDTSFAAALRQAIAHRGLALNRIRTHLADRGLHVGIATLSTWQSGRRVPRDDSLAVITALEELLNVPPGWLTVRIPPARSDVMTSHRPPHRETIGPDGSRQVACQRAAQADADVVGCRGLRHP